MSGTNYNVSAVTGIDSVLHRVDSVAPHMARDIVRHDLCKVKRLLSFFLKSCQRDEADPKLDEGPLLEECIKEVMAISTDKNILDALDN